MSSAATILFTAISGNAKTGPIPVSGSVASTCPSVCPFAPKAGKANGCYAAYGPIAWHWAKLNAGKVGHTWNEFLAKVRGIYRGSLWRHNQFGDLAGEGNSIDANALRELVAANAGRKGYTYTHKPVHANAAHKVSSALARANRAIIKFANQNGFTINLSGNNLAHADKLKALGIGPVVSVIPQNSPNSFLSPAGHKVIVCPASYKEGFTCAHCRLCAVTNRGCIVGFKAHGMGAKYVEAQVGA